MSARPKPNKPVAPQSGILNRPPEHLLLVAADLTGPSAGDSLERLRDLIRRELSSNLDGLGDAGTPPAETGELGFADNYDRQHLTITLGLGRHAFELLGVAKDDQPQDLVDIPWSQLGDTPETPANSDLILQICSDSGYIAEHVLRRIEEELRSELRVAWVHSGVQRYSSRAGRTARSEGRAWLGFLDGTHNLHPRASEDDAKLVFIDPQQAVIDAYPKLPQPAQPGQPGYGGGGPGFPADLRPPPVREPVWTEHGSYLTVRVSVNDLATWDQQTLDGQQQAVGQFKETGVSLDRDPHDPLGSEPAYASNQGDVRVALNAHVRKANPHTAPDDAQRQLFRRGYPLYEAAGAEGLRRGLVFLAFGRTLSTQFEFVTRAWLNNPDFPQPGAGVDQLRSIDTRVLAGGYYFVPALSQRNRPWSWLLPPETVA